MTDNDAASLLHQVADLAGDFRVGLSDADHAPRRGYVECLASFNEPLPSAATPATEVIAQLAAGSADGLIMPAGPRFFGWVMGSSHPAGVAADCLTGAWGQLGAHPTVTPAASAVEAVAEGWLLELLDLPRASSIGFATGATVANFTCLAAARGEVLRQAGWDADRDGLFGAPPITVLIGDDAHSTVFMALQYLGLGHDRVVRLATDDQGRVRPDAFLAAMAGVKGPAIVILQAGQLNTGAFDPFADIIPVAKQAGAWVHVDGAFGLWARATPALRHLTAGIDGADSWATDGHKWLQVPYDCGFAIVRDELAHRRAMSISASYLPASEAGDRVSFNYVPELSRRARGNPVWAVIKTLGRDGIVEMIDRHCRVARLMAGLLGDEPGVTVENDVVLNQVAVRFGAGLGAERGDQITRDTIARVQAGGVCFAAGADWRGRHIMRISVSSFATSEEDGRRSAEAMLTAYRNARQQA